MTGPAYWVAFLVFASSTLTAANAQREAETAAAPAQSVANSSGAGLAGPPIYASSVGARLDSNLEDGGGTDDTRALQKILDGASHGKAIHLVIDGAALVGGLDVYGNTTIECTTGGGLYLKDNSSRAILRNARRSRGVILDEHIEIRGCFLNGNRKHQPSADIARPDLPGFKAPSNKEKDGTFLSGLQFLGVKHVKIQDITLWNVRAFGVLIANAEGVEIRNVTVDHGGPPQADAADALQTDGLHFKGPLRDVTIDTVKFRVGDDAIAFNANDFETDDITTRNDFGPYVGQGPITDVTVNNVELNDTAYGVRILSTRERIDRISIRNVRGTVTQAYLLNISHWMNPTSFGNVGHIMLDDIAVDRPKAAPLPPESVARSSSNKLWFGEGNGGETPLININCPVEHLQIRRLVTHVQDGRPLVRIGPDAAVAILELDLTAHDPSASASILKLDAGGHVERMNFELEWNGNTYRNSAK